MTKRALQKRRYLATKDAGMLRDVPVKKRKGYLVLKKILAMILLLGCAVSVAAQTPADVPRGHWAYDAIRELAKQGYMLGYPNGDFMGDRTLTRYEFATMVARILEGVNERLAAVQAQAARPATTAPATTTVPTTPAGAVTAQDLDTVSKLVDEFKVELTVIGTRLDSIESTVEALKNTVEMHDAMLQDEEGIVKSTAADVSKLKKVSVGGYLQARYQTLDFTKDTKSEDAYDDTFMVRRARVKVKATPTIRSTAVIQLDAAKNNVGVKDAYYNYAFGDGTAIAYSFQVGQQAWWFGYEVPYSSSRRETPEKALFVRRFFPGDFDTGAVLMSPTDNDIQWYLGCYNGTGIDNGKTSATDNNDAKDLVANVKFKLGDCDLGLSGYRGRGIWYDDGDSYDPTPKIRYGADIQYFMNNFTFKGEYIRGKGFDGVDPTTYDQSKWQDGYYAQINYNINTDNTFVARYSSMSEDPKAIKYGRIDSWDLGLIRWLDSKSRLKLFYKITSEEFNEIDDNDAFCAEWIVTY